MLANLMGLGGCVEYDANSVCLKFDSSATEGAVVNSNSKSSTTQSTSVPLSTCPWYSKPEIGATALVCTFPSNAVLWLGAAAIGILVFLSVRS
jgi:hypothetical protein